MERLGMTEPTQWSTPEVILSEGTYIITPNEYVHTPQHRDTIILHTCPNPPETHTKTWGNYPYRCVIAYQENLEYPCHRCDQTCPERIRTLWTLQNFDTFAKDSHETWDQEPWAINYL